METPNGYYYQNSKRISEDAFIKVRGEHKEIARGSLREIAQRVPIDETSETCGILTKGSGFTCYQTNTGGKGSCVIHGRRQKYIWHTHPSKGKIYPSPEDILMMLRRIIKKSIIFTIQGFWVIEKNIDPNFIIEKNKVYHDRYKLIDTQNKKLYFSKETNKGRLYDKNIFNQYTESIQRIMNNDISLKFYTI